MSSWEKALADYAQSKVDQALKSQLEQVEELQDSPPPFSADKENPMKHAYQNEGYRKALDDIIALRVKSLGEAPENILFIPNHKLETK